MDIYHLSTGFNKRVQGLGVRILVLNATFYNISVMWWQVTDKLYQNIVVSRTLRHEQGSNSQL
jgi:hypothetical protein